MLRPGRRLLLMAVHSKLSMFSTIAPWLQTILTLFCGSTDLLAFDVLRSLPCRSTSASFAIKHAIIATSKPGPSGPR